MADDEGQASSAKGSTNASPRGGYSKRAKDLPGHFPQPIITPPQLKHRQTFIILHGRGSTAEKFAPPLLEMTATSNPRENLQTAFPHAKLVFLTASRNRATIYKRSYTHQWFDHWHMNEDTKRQDLMRDGLRKSCVYLHSILRREIELVGKKNVVLWGLSQGCATSLISLLTWDGEPFAALVGMCGFLPFENHMRDIVKGNSLGSGDRSFGQVEDDDLFSHSGEEDDDNDLFENDSSVKQDLPTQAVMFVRNEIDMEEKDGMTSGDEMVFRKVRVFLGHGAEDDNVPIRLGRKAKICLEQLGADVQMMEYQGLGHWYSEEMLRDIFSFLKERLCVEGS